MASVDRPLRNKSIRPVEYLPVMKKKNSTHEFQKKKRTLDQIIFTEQTIIKTSDFEKPS